MHKETSQCHKSDGFERQFFSLGNKHLKLNLLNVNLLDQHCTFGFCFSLLGPSHQALPMNSAGSYVRESFKNKVHERKSLTRDIHSPNVPPPPTHRSTRVFCVWTERSSGTLIQLAQLAELEIKKQTAAEIIVSPAVLQSCGKPLAPLSTSVSRLEKPTCWVFELLSFLFPMTARPRDFRMGQALLCVSFHCDQTGCLSWFFWLQMKDCGHSQLSRQLSIEHLQ